MSISSPNGRYFRLDKGRFFKCYQFNMDWKVHAIANQEACRNEVKNLQAIGIHSNIVRLIHYVEKWAHGIHMGELELEWLSNGSLQKIAFSSDWIYSDHTIYLWAEDILKGLIHLHSIEIKHCDIKLSNVMLSSVFVAKIGDFDLSLKDDSSGESNKIVGTERAKAPELWIHNYVSRKNDVWSFGVVLWELIRRRWCFHQEGHILAAMSRRRELEPPKIPFNHPLCDLIIACTIQSRVVRPDSMQIFEIVKTLLEVEAPNYMQRKFLPEVIGMNRTGTPPTPIGFERNVNETCLDSVQISENLRSKAFHKREPNIDETEIQLPSFLLDGEFYMETIPEEPAETVYPEKDLGMVSFKSSGKAKRRQSTTLADEIENRKPGLDQALRVESPDQMNHNPEPVTVNNNTFPRRFTLFSNSIPTRTTNGSDSGRGITITSRNTSAPPSSVYSSFADRKKFYFRHDNRPTTPVEALNVATLTETNTQRNRTLSQSQPKKRKNSIGKTLVAPFEWIWQICQGEEVDEHVHRISHQSDEARRAQVAEHLQY